MGFSSLYQPPEYKCTFIIHLHKWLSLLGIVYYMLYICTNIYWCTPIMFWKEQDAGYKFVCFGSHFCRFGLFKTVITKIIETQPCACLWKLLIWIFQYHNLKFPIFLMFTCTMYIFLTHNVVILVNLYSPDPQYGLFQLICIFLTRNVGHSC